MKTVGMSMCTLHHVLHLVHIVSLNVGQAAMTWSLSQFSKADGAVTVMRVTRSDDEDSDADGVVNPKVTVYMYYLASWRLVVDVCCCAQALTAHLVTGSSHDNVKTWQSTADFTRKLCSINATNVQSKTSPHHGQAISVLPAHKHVKMTLSCTPCMCSAHSRMAQSPSLERKRLQQCKRSSTAGMAPCQQVGMHASIATSEA